MIYTPQTLMKMIQFWIEVENYCRYCTGTPCKCEDINSKIDEL